MLEFGWEEIKQRYCLNPNSHTKKGKPFHVSKTDLQTVYIDLPSGKQSVSRKNLAKAVRLINKGTRIDGPSDYKLLVADERPAYAWAILRDMGFIK